MTLALDGHAFGSGTTSTATVTLTTTSPNDVIVVFAGNNRAAGAATVLSITGTGITFQGTARIVNDSGNSGVFGIELWYGTAAAALSSVVITVTFNHSTTSTIMAFGVSGANTSSISDSNSSLPGNANGANTLPQITGISSNNANDMFICGVIQNAATTQTAGTSFTLIDTTGTTIPGADEYAVVSVTQSNATVKFGTTTGAGVGWVMVVDAIQAALPPTPLKRRRNYIVQG